MYGVYRLKSPEWEKVVNASSAACLQPPYITTLFLIVLNALPSSKLKSYSVNIKCHQRITLYDYHLIIELTLLEIRVIRGGGFTSTYIEPLKVFRVREKPVKVFWKTKKSFG
jgi:hypothetical protein